MPPRNRKDLFDQTLFMQMTETAANTLSFAQLAVGVSIFDYAAFIISRIEYYWNPGALAGIDADQDSITVALTGSGSITVLDRSQPQVYDLASWIGALDGTAATMARYESPTIHDFAAMKGGGLLVPAQDMFIAVLGNGQATARTGTILAYYSVMELAAADYLEVAQKYRVIST